MRTTIPFSNRASVCLHGYMRVGRVTVCAVIVCLAVLVSSASADTLTASFDIAPNSGAIVPSIGTMQMTVNLDGSIGISLNSIYPIYFFFFDDTHIADLPLTYSGLSACYSPIGGASGGGFGNMFNGGFIPNGCYDPILGYQLPSSVSFSVFGQQPFTSVYELVGVGPLWNQNLPTVEFVLDPPYGAGAEQGANVNAPEPGSLALLGSGLLALAGTVRRKL